MPHPVFSSITESSRPRDIGTRMRHVRMIRGLRQKQVADQLAVSISHYSKVELGINRCSGNMLQRFCDLFGVDPEWLARGRGAPFLTTNDATPVYANRLLAAGRNEAPAPDAFLDQAADAIVAMLSKVSLAKLRETANELDIPFEHLLRLKILDCLRRTL